jgi:hypothetical protein
MQTDMFYTLSAVQVDYRLAAIRDDSEPPLYTPVLAVLLGILLFLLHFQHVLYLKEFRRSLVCTRI